MGPWWGGYWWRVGGRWPCERVSRLTSGKCSPPLRQMAAKTFARPGPPVPVPRRQGRATTTRFRRVTPVSAPKRTHARMQALTHVHMHRRAFTRTHTNMHAHTHSPVNTYTHVLPRSLHFGWLILSWSQLPWDSLSHHLSGAHTHTWHLVLFRGTDGSPRPHSHHQAPAQWLRDDGVSTDKLQRPVANFASLKRGTRESEWLLKWVRFLTLPPSHPRVWVCALTTHASSATACAHQNRKKGVKSGQEDCWTTIWPTITSFAPSSSMAGLVET